ncbi:MAG: GIY-YIG nuclease family protein [Clostridia bacterium]|nr:GIY-YIG nuclease family protein [Clostridia bacterium]
MAENGVIYILTNPSFPDYVKIGYAKNVKERLNQLNRSECIPFAFRVYATYEVESTLSDKKLHDIIDKLNPDLRAIETFNGKQRKREFYAMSPEDAYSLLQSIAAIHGYESRLVLVEPDATEKQEEAMAEAITKERSKGENFSFFKCHIPVGATLVYVGNEEITCTVVDDRKIDYNGQIMYTTTLAKILTGRKHGVNGPMYFTYNGKNLGTYYDEFQGK